MSPLPLPTNFNLIAGGCITVDNIQKVRLCLSTKGQLAITRAAATLWAASAAPQTCDLTQSWINGCHLTAQGDGNTRALQRHALGHERLLGRPPPPGPPTRVVLANTAALPHRAQRPGHRGLEQRHLPLSPRRLFPRPARLPGRGQGRDVAKP